MIRIDQALELLFPQISAKQRDNLEQTLFSKSKVFQTLSDTIIFSPGDSCEDYLFLLEGQIKVYSNAVNGKEILLYRIRPGQTCIVSTNCMMGSHLYPASAKTVGPCLALSAPVGLLHEALQNTPALNQFIMDNFFHRIACLIELVSEVALERLDVRLARHLLKLRDPNQEIHTTHEELAKEIGTAREVISRQLKQFEYSGWVETSRGLIRIQNEDTLSNLSEGFFS